MTDEVVPCTEALIHCLYFVHMEDVIQANDLTLCNSIFIC